MSVGEYIVGAPRISIALAGKSRRVSWVDGRIPQLWRPSRPSPVSADARPFLVVRTAGLWPLKMATFAGLRREVVSAGTHQTLKVVEIRAEQVTGGGRKTRGMVWQELTHVRIA